MGSLILTHLGESVPPYMRDCIHQIRLWNISTPIYIILWPCHTGEFWSNLVSDYNVTLVYTNTLVETQHHTYFLNNFIGDMNFRKGYWRHVKERFFFIEELMLRESLEQCISMEYDVLVYMSLDRLFEKLRQSHQTMRMVRDNDERGHPAFLYIPTAKQIREFTLFILKIIKSPLEDMQSLATYADIHPNNVHYFPVITETRNRTIPSRKSISGHTTSDPKYLSEDSEYFDMLFDSLVIGQWVSGVDSRNIGGTKITHYMNESALYQIDEMKFEWKKSLQTYLWIPILDGLQVCTIHMHSKALKSFLSDRSDYPCDDYNVSDIHKGLLPK